MVIRMVMEIGRLCVKKRGREEGQKCAVIDVIDDTYVLIDGPEVKRRRCNVKHLEPLEQKLEIGKGASSDDINRALTESGSKETEKPPEPGGEGEPVEPEPEEEKESEEKEEPEQEEVEEKESEEKEEPERESGS